LKISEKISYNNKSYRRSCVDHMSLNWWYENKISFLILASLLNLESHITMKQVNNSNNGHHVWSIWFSV
jgi:hypothetical protein